MFRQQDGPRSTVHGLFALAGQDVTSCIEADSYSYMLGPQQLAIARVRFASAPLFSSRQDRGRRRYLAGKQERARFAMLQFSDVSQFGTVSSNR